MEASDEVEEELEAILAIIMDGIEVSRKSEAIEIQVQISPLTALDSDQSFVGFLLLLLLEKNYPEYPPKLQVSFKKEKTNIKKTAKNEITPFGFQRQMVL